MAMKNKKLAHIETLALLDGTQSRTIYSNDEASLSSPVLQGEKSRLFQHYQKERKNPLPVDLAKELGNICNTLNTIVEQRKVKSPSIYGSKVNGLLESLDACLDRVVSESESSGPSTPAELGQDSQDMAGPRKFSNASTNSTTSERSEPSSFFAWGSELSGSSRSMKDAAGIATAQIKEVSLSEVYMDAILAGWLNKLRINSTSFFNRKTWKRRLLVLTQTHLYQFKTSAAQSKSTNAFEITASTTVTICEKYPEKRWVLEIRADSQHPWLIQAESLEDLKTWLNSLRASIVRAKYAIRTLPEVPLGNVYREMIRRTSANNVQTARPRIPRPSKSMSHAQSSNLVQNSRTIHDQSAQAPSQPQLQSKRQTKPRIDIKISHSPFFDNSLLANISCSPTKSTFSPTVSRKPSSTLPTVMEC
ncbi:hypothetical protein K7432_006868 [Basidiobolus ranarum]|uniref:PH domain-containing protein n=1 Tax=Basidiobolus ranarum TaxID=34480 RepID=A0ABR2WUA0_9FUNG